MSRLLLIEGLPGAGKSTLAQLVKDVLDERNIDNQLFVEGDLDHPSDYDQVAFFSHQEYAALATNFHEDRNILEMIVEKTAKGVFIPYGKHRESLKDKLLDLVMEKDIYELPFKLHTDLILDRWKTFSENHKKDCVYIFECCFIQNPITVGMIRDNQPEDYILNYMQHIRKTIEPMNPILFYLHQDDVEKSFNKVISVRPIEWYTGFMDYYLLRGYGKDNHLTGLKGIVDTLKARRALEYRIIEEINIDKCFINNTDYNKEKNREIIKQIVEKHLIH